MSKRLYIVTGKGGVGKTTLSLALAKSLTHKYPKKNIYYNSFDHPANQEICNKLGIKSLNLPLEDSTLEYISRKLANKTIATWICKSPFFKALFNIVPGLGNMITLGHIIDRVEKNENEIIVVDAPSSGHLLTVLESPSNFKSIFKSGPLVSDIHRMINFIGNSSLTEAWVISIPTELAVTEGIELKERIETHGLQSIKSILNTAISHNSTFKNIELPDFLKSKITIEEEIIATTNVNYSLIIPMFIDKTPIQLVKKIEEKLLDFI